MQRERYDGWLGSLKRGLCDLWPDEAVTSIQQLIDELQVCSTDELHAEWLCGLEVRAVENYQQSSDLESATHSVVEDLASSLRYFADSVRQFIHARDAADRSLSRFLEVGFAIADCEYPSGQIRSFVSMRIPKEKSDVSATDPREEADNPNHQEDDSGKVPWRVGRRPDHDPQPELIVYDHSPGTLAITEAAVEAVLQRLHHVSPPLQSAQTKRIAELVEGFRRRCPADDTAAFDLIHQRLSESILPTPDVDEVEWNGIRVNLKTKKVHWDVREPFIIDENVPLRLLYLLVRHEGRILQSELVEMLWNNSSKVLDRDRALAKVRSKLDHVLQKQSGWRSTAAEELADAPRAQIKPRRQPQPKPVHVVPENADESSRKQYGPNCTMKLRLELPMPPNSSVRETSGFPSPPPPIPDL